MLIYHRTSLMESRAQTVVNTVNCVGVMGKGVAAAFKDRYPAMFEAYKRICDAGELEPGKLWLWQGPQQWVLNFPTKKHWRNPSKLEWVEAGLDKFVRTYEYRGITDISFPRLGCGNGGLDWEHVRPVMERYLGNLSIPVYIHDYSYEVGIPEHLEAIIRQLSSKSAPVTSFAKFMDAINAALSASGGNLVDIETEAPFKASLEGDALTISIDGQSSKIELEDLQGLWITLQSGFVTKQRAAWATGDGGCQALSLLMLIPGTRAVQIRRPNCDPEIAVELKPKFGAQNVFAASSEQPRLSWA